jgi:hypothetical protein
VLSGFQDFRLSITMRVYRSPRSSGQCSKPVARISISRMRAFRLVGFKAFNHDARSKINRASRPRFYTRCAHQCSARARGFRISGFKAFRLSRFQAFRLPGFPDFRLLGLKAFRISGFQSQCAFKDYPSFPAKVLNPLHAGV